MHVSDCYLPRLGGIENQVSGLARAQASAGHDVHVVTATGSALLDPSAVAPHIRRIGQESAGALALPPQGVLRAVATIRAALDDIDPDVVHVHSSVVSPLALVAAVASARAGRATVVTVHSMWAYLKRPYRALCGLLDVAGLPIEWTAVSSAAAGEVRHVLDRARDVSVLPNGIDADYWRRTAPTPAGPEIVVAAVMRLTARKRPISVLAALRAARTALPELPIRGVIHGAGPHHRLLRSYVTVHGMRDQVQVCGSGDREQVRQLLGRAQVFLAPARLESFGIAALEARCAGVPVIARTGTGISDFVRHGWDGLLVDSSAGIGEALTHLLGTPELRMAMSRHSRRNPPAYGWPVTLAAADAAYERATSAGSIRAARCGRREVLRGDRPAISTGPR